MKATSKNIKNEDDLNKNQNEDNLKKIRNEENKTKSEDNIKRT